jgi:hypothetical protein
MAALRWTAVAAVTGVLASQSGLAAAQEPTPTPTATPEPTPTPFPVPVPVPPPPAVAGTVIYIITVTTTTTTTAINAPITWIAAPITTNVSNANATTDTTANNVNSSTAGTPAGTPASNGANPAGGQTELSLSGCGAKARSARGNAVIQTARIRVPSDAQLAVRVNGKSVGNLRLDPGARKARGIPLRVELAASGMLTVYRPSGRILRVQACTPK